ncbi:MAG TPA: polysaccharide biosynthesis/export family protein [Ignavibacteriaceae bacterium]|nr:polysaccharide biosynthesis/export family protein [Ignavibacteriaceae bacterium]
MKRFLGGIFLLCVVFHFTSEAQTLHPGDGLKLIFYNISDQISGEYYIQEDGTIALPFLGIIKVADRNVDSLKQEIYGKYSNIYRNPELTILPLIRVNIFGEVNKPGFYYATGTDKLTDLIAKAGGTTPQADIGDITITRDGREIEIDGEKIIENGNKLNDIGLQSGDQIYVTRKWFSGSTQAIVITGISTLTAILIVFLRK